MMLLSAASLLMMSLIYAPVSWWPLAFVCLVPWLIMMGAATHAPRVYAYSFVLALVFFLINMRWLYAATGWGYLALSVYLSLFFPLIALAVRHVVRRRRWPLALAFPFVWTGGELLRAVVLSGFPWFFLSHSLYNVQSMIQVSDLVGAYGVSFVVAAVNGALADAIFAWSTSRRSGSRLGVNPRKVGFSVALAAVLVIGTLLYGFMSLGRDTMSTGPKIALVQGDYINSVYPDLLRDHDHVSEEEKMLTYFSMLEEAARRKPDLYVLPETPWIMYLNAEARNIFELARVSYARFRDHAIKNNGVIVTGSATLEPSPYDVLATERRYNSATVFYPDGSEPRRYDKRHLVYFGEVVPFRFGRLRWLYFWLNRVMPFSGPDGDFEYSVFPGEGFRRFSMLAPSRDGRAYRFSTPICYEDVMPYVSRRFTSGGAPEKQVDFLLNISNDGWFGRGIQQPQHLAICVFRAVENRVGIARSVNTGVSAFIDPDGRVHDVVHGNPETPWPGACGISVANVMVDSRYTLYSRYGDWFAWGCAVLWAVLIVDYWVTRARTAGMHPGGRAGAAIGKASTDARDRRPNLREAAAWRAAAERHARD